MSEATNVPGVNDFPGETRSRSRENSFSDTRQNGEGTVTPDLGDPSESAKKRASFVNKDKPIFGFLYSVSRTAYGEFWPLYLGPNTIGRTDCDIVLNEGTVSANHAVITIHQDEDTNEVFASLADKESTHGVRLNGKNIRFDRVECKNMDIIKIGMNYELLFILVDTGSLNLKPSESFVDVKQKSSKNTDPRIVTGPTPKNRLSNPERTVPMDSMGESEKSGGTRTR